MTTPPPPLDRFFVRLAELTQHQTDLDEVADLLVSFTAAERDYLQQAIRDHGDRSGTTRLHAPERGPRLTLAHRRVGEMSAVHSHEVWVAITPIVGAETHRRFDVSTGEPVLAEERVLHPGEAVAFAPPGDTHAHGHVEGTGDPAYVLILAGDNQRAFHRHQYNLNTGEVTPLAPGDAGDWLA